MRNPTAVFAGQQPNSSLRQLAITLCLGLSLALQGCSWFGDDEKLVEIERIVNTDEELDDPATDAADRVESGDDKDSGDDSPKASADSQTGSSDGADTDAPEQDDTDDDQQSDDVSEDD